MMKTSKSVAAARADLEQPAAQAPAGISEAGRKWLEENAEAIKSINEWVEKNGLPLERYRMF